MIHIDIEFDFVRAMCFKLKLTKECVFKQYEYARKRENTRRSLETKMR